MPWIFSAAWVDGARASSAQAISKILRRGGKDIIVRVGATLVAAGCWLLAAGCWLLAAILLNSLKLVKFLSGI
ncbi:hypothetical protein H097_03397 [Pseudomonas sp. FH4]|nr:hypothetical protein H097_03397 [Pseudomonas sp. FH4]